MFLFTMHDVLYISNSCLQFKYQGTMTRYIFLLMISGILLSCKTAVDTYSAASNPKGETRIIFVTLKVRKDSIGREIIDLANKQWVTGKLKKQREYAGSMNGAFLCEFLDASKKVRSNAVVENPLVSVKEQYSSDGSIARKEVKLDTSYITIRSEVSTDVVTLRISKGKDIMGLFELR
jgi:hypothetical protein